MRESSTKCPVCLQMEDEERARETAIRSAFVGHAAYAICLRCGLEVSDREDPEYLARVKRYIGALES